MAEIHASSTEHPRETLAMSIDAPDLDLTTAREIAKKRARELDPNAMMLSYHSAKTGEFWPAYDCGGAGRPPWVVFAEARGYNLKIDINDGDYEFFYLRF